MTNKLRVWWIPQIPGKPFHVEVSSQEEAIKMLNTLAAYDLFQFNNNIKPDYCNVGGLEEFVEENGEDKPCWMEWCDEETGQDINELLQAKG